MRPIIALLTDFGTKDAYVAAVKGVLLSGCPEATLVDITHEVAPFDVLEAALALESVFRYFPPRTVFLVVVDPEVGSTRRCIALRAGERVYVGPDNGVLGLVLAANPQVETREIVQRAGSRVEITATFHARDVFAPAAALLANGAALAEIGPPLHDPIGLSLPPVTADAADEWIATVIHVDRFGNLVTNVTRAHLEQFAIVAQRDDRLAAVVGDEELPFVKTYSDVRKGDAAVLFGGGGRLEAAVRRGNAASRFGLSKGDVFHLRGGLPGDK
jgi:S-adenosylmethionine hydrolase